MPTILDRIRSAFRSPADRRLEAAAISRVPLSVDKLPGYRPGGPAEPSTRAIQIRMDGQTVPFGPGSQPSPSIPSIYYDNDQVRPSPTDYAFRPGYSDHTFKAMFAPLNFAGWNLQRVRNAVFQHSEGIFLESSILAFVCLRFAPVAAALGQAISPVLALPRRVSGGTKGIARVLRDDIEDQLVPRDGLLDSPYFPSTLWGTMAIYLSFFRFAVLQHVDGEPDPETGIRPRYSRIWHPWAVQRTRTPDLWLALTTEGPVEICNDGHFTLVMDEVEGYLSAPILSVGEEVLMGRQTQQAASALLQAFSQPKLLGIMPDHMSLLSPEGMAFKAALRGIVSPDGYAALPFGSDVKFASLKEMESEFFDSRLSSVILHIAFALLGSDRTMQGGGKDGVVGPYMGPNGFKVSRTVQARTLACTCRAVNTGHIAPQLNENYAAGILGAKRAGTWVAPTLTIPIPDPDADARIEAAGKHEKLLCEIIEARRDAGLVIDPDTLDKLAEKLETVPAQLVTDDDLPEIFEWEANLLLFSPDEIRARKRAPALPIDPATGIGIGSVEQLARDRLAGKDKAGQKAPEADPGETGATPPAGGDADAGPSTQRSAPVAPKPASV
jgi:hypothetical protein